MKIRPNGIDGMQTGKAGAAQGSERTNAAAGKGNGPGPITAASAAPVQGKEFSSRIQTLRAQVAAGDSVDHAKVERVSQAVQDGTFRVDAGVVADRMLQGAADLLKKNG
jgi:negative regulator of flagellin synthesis FlgM